MAFTVRSDYGHSDDGRNHSVTGSCNACQKPIVAMLQHKHTSHWKASGITGDLLSSSDVHLVAVWPTPKKLDLPASIPDKVSTNYREAAEARRRKSWNAACSMYRRTMEIALKQFAPDIEAWKLEKRIDKLAAEGRITEDMKEWAHELRLDGNEALHGDADATEEMADQMADLCYFLLIYLYTLPNQIASARARREGA